MSTSDTAPHVALDPACADKDGAHDPEKHDAPRDSKGWDGKLRVDRKAQVVNADGHSGGEESEDEEGPPPEEIAADEDLLDDVDEDEEDIELVHFRISSIPALRLERFKKIQVCILPLTAAPVSRQTLTSAAPLSPTKPNFDCRATRFHCSHFARPRSV